MRAADLDLRELVIFEPQGGVIRFAGQRALLMDAVALGLLRKELIGTVGMAAARGVLTRFGFAHGWRTAEAMKTRSPGPTRASGASGRPAAHPAGAGPPSRSPARTTRPPVAVGDLARLLRGRAAPAPPGPGRPAGVLDAHRVRERLLVATATRSTAWRRAAWQGRRRLPGRGPLAGGLGRVHGGAALLRDAVHRGTLGQVTEALKQAEKRLRRKRELARTDAGPTLRGSWREPGDAAGAGPGAPRGQGGHDGPHHRRERRGQGAHRPAHP